ncbi:MAG: DUF3471 domain-containing protein [Pseudomonadota bacterium]
MDNFDATPVAWKRYEQMRPRTEIDVDPKTLDAYVGHFAFADSQVAEIGVQDGQLTMRLVGQPAVELFPEARDAFFLKAVPAQVTFRRERSTVTALTLHQHGHDHRAQRCSVRQFIEAELARKAHARRRQPLNGSESTLTRMLEEQRASTPDYARMTDELEALVREQLPLAKAELTRLGTLQSLTFRRATEAGFDVFDARFANGTVEAGISFSGDGRVNGFYLRP